MEDQNFKVGEVLLCKKSASFILTKNNEYKIIEITSTSDVNFSYIISDDRVELFHLTNYIFLYEYFCNKNEYRKIKLERLNIL